MPDSDVHVVGIDGPDRSYASLIAEHCRGVGLRCSVDTIPFVSVGEFSGTIARRLKAMLAAAPTGSFTVYTSGWAEFFLQEADLSLHFSHYRRWFDPARARVLPYAWTNARPDIEQHVFWKAKPRLTVGFRGMTYRASRSARLGSRAPSLVQRWVLEGHHLRFPTLFGMAVSSRVPIGFVAAFPRFEALEALSATAPEFGIDVEIEDTGRVFLGSRDLVATYEQHLLRHTYILCPRGAENYSFRVYEALRFGRIPVIIDTDMVLPDEVAWDEVAIRVPIEDLRSIGRIIAEDYRRRSPAQFRARQQLAVETSKLLDGESWLTGVAQDIRRRVQARRGERAESTEYSIKSLDSAPII